MKSIKNQFIGFSIIIIIIIGFASHKVQSLGNSTCVSNRGPQLARQTIAIELQNKFNDYNQYHLHHHTWSESLLRSITVPQSAVAHTAVKMDL